MLEKEFNLLEEPWIRVSAMDLEQKEVSLSDALLHAQEYADLSGETPAVDAAILRLLLAMAQTVFYRYNEMGERKALSKENGEHTTEVLERFKAYWELGRFPEKAVKEYMRVSHERFWLFHKETPFYQVPDLQYGTDYGVECLIGNMKESNNKATRHHFSMAEGEALERLGYAEATRWLIHLMAYGVNIKADENAPGSALPVGTGRLGQLGLVAVGENNLFRVLMLNLCALRDGDSAWGEPRPAWEQAVQMEQGVQIPQPDNLPELYTMQSRRVMLKRKDGFVNGFRAAGGDFCSMEDGFHEQMTLWREVKMKKGMQRPVFVPQAHDAAMHAWEEFPALMYGREGGRIPGLVLWIKFLRDENAASLDGLVQFRMVGIVYGDQMRYTYGDCINDSLTLSAGLLSGMWEEWNQYISNEVENCQKVAKVAIGNFAKNMKELLCGGEGKKGDANSGNGIRQTLVRSYFYKIDRAFRAWLAGIRPEEDSREEKQEEWERESYRFARQTVEEFIAMRNINLYACKQREDKKGKSVSITAPQAMNQYIKELWRIYPGIVEGKAASADGAWGR